MDINDLKPVLSMEALSSLTPWSEKMFLEEMRNPASHCYVIKDLQNAGDPVLGFICFRRVIDESELLNLCVHPGYRRRGIGRVLMTFYIDLCREYHIRQFFLEVDPENQAALRLYRSLSYQPVGVRPRFYRGKTDALLMKKTA